MNDQNPPRGYQHQPPPYQQPYQQPYYAHPPPPQPPRLSLHHRLQWWYNITRPWAIVVPAITLIMDVWWFAAGRLCGYTDSVMDECFWVLWLSLPLAVVSLVWNLAATISTRRIMHQRPGFAPGLQFGGQALVACGASVCLGLLARHFAMYMDAWWSSSLEGAMIALISIITFFNWVLTAFAAYEWAMERRARDEEMYVL
ncbi:uncharacterized protein F5Z01DRAFT_266155 [Emericellopsis atlantica]|uniref:Transmembrane protein n=1 Tax=Emericellopsis atlantica TaxID=2614577 RepID=A0A9P7ZGP3_9HYPO|nr:uncharacterized protein F5Z01DRAFT_266155 [Emericellopsis atlantica]KAG9251779.1 hypothetical protein F5Z01DRAFT_266155 [Emericellopsis atlantica]